MVDLLRPPAHRGPLIAAGAVLVTVALLLVESRFDDTWADGVHVAVLGIAAALMLGIAVQVRPEGGQPPAWQSVLLVSGLALLLLELLRLREALGDGGELGAGAVTWILLVFGGLALLPAIRNGSAVCGFLAALAFGGALLSGWEWVFDPDGFTAFRWLLLVLATTYAIVSLVLRAGAPRHSELLVDAAGISILAIAVFEPLLGVFTFGFGGEDLPGFWEAVVLVAGCGLLAYAAADKSPGPAYLGTVCLIAFTINVAGDDPTLKWWPLILLVLGLLAMGAGLRPRRPLPPEPDAYTAGTMPLAARSEGETVIRVRDES